jgi:hypothetical protein
VCCIDAHWTPTPSLTVDGDSTTIITNHSFALTAVAEPVASLYGLCEQPPHTHPRAQSLMSVLNHQRTQ